MASFLVVSILVNGREAFTLSFIIFLIFVISVVFMFLSILQNIPLSNEYFTIIFVSFPNTSKADTSNRYNSPLSYILFPCFVLISYSDNVPLLLIVSS